MLESSREREHKLNEQLQKNLDKRTHELIPLCHALPVTFVGVEAAVDANAGTVTLTAEARATARTGVEMEALTAAAIAALTVYDMCKAVDRTMTVESIRLEEKAGGRTGPFRRAD